MTDQKVLDRILKNYCDMKADRWADLSLFNRRWPPGPNRIDAILQLWLARVRFARTLERLEEITD